MKIIDLLIIADILSKLSPKKQKEFREWLKNLSIDKINEFHENKKL
jgi:hypothetical protein